MDDLAPFDEIQLRGWHAFFRQYQPPTLVVWGEGDFVFGVPGAEGYRQDLKQIEVLY